MLIGIPKEIKTHEYRVGMTPSSVRELVHHGHQVIVETNAGRAIGLDDALYQVAGADIVDNAEDVFARPVFEITSSPRAKRKESSGPSLVPIRPLSKERIVWWCVSPQ